MMRLYVITYEVNEYYQHGEYLHSIHTTSEAAHAAVDHFGRVGAEDVWYNLHEIDVGERGIKFATGH